MQNSLPNKIVAPIRRWNLIFVVFLVMQLVGWYLALFKIGSDIDQGNVYRIIFVHVPVAWCAFFWFFFSATCSILSF
ncbi:MAG: hypothetical protein V4591_03520, partial [Bdellovibrionota bacterium]